MEHLLDAARRITIVGLDPSSTMMHGATKRLRRHPHRDAVELVQTTLDRFDPRRGPFDGAIAVNSQQLWNPHSSSVDVLARVLHPGASLVSLTHDWAITKRTTMEAWRARVTGDLGRAGFDSPTWRTGHYRSGHATELIVCRSRDPPSSATRERAATT